MNAPFRRGACPGLSAPMQTGDGLLVRLLPVGTLSLDAFASLCAAARRHGNGVVEVTARGSIQVRGLSAASASPFATAVAALRIAAVDGVAVHAGPLAGLDPDEILDAEMLASDLRRVLAEHAPATQLAPKISIAIDGGGALGLDQLSADVRLRAVLKAGQAVLAVSVGGDRAGAMQLGFVAPADAVAAVRRILETIAQRGRDVRARDIIGNEGVEPFGRAVRDLLSVPVGPRESEPAELDSRSCGNERKSAIDAHPLRDGLFACGIGIAFGHADATAFEDLTKAAAAQGATGLRAAPGRALIFVGFAPEALAAFASDAERLGFIVRADDPRRFVVACAGAPICASAHIASRALGPCIAAACTESLGEHCTIHLSGCAKGCAHPTAAALTVVGTAEGCGLAVNGTARDMPFEILTVDELPAALARHAHALAAGARHV